MVRDLDENYHHPLDIGSLARRVGMGEFRRMFGMAPSQATGFVPPGAGAR